MKLNLERARKRKRGIEQLELLGSNPEHVLVVHYSCESFYDRPEGASPRITSLAVRNLGTGLTESFSIHQVAEPKGIAAKDIAGNYNELESEMLVAFSAFIERHDKYSWVHWNMGDTNYGFPAIEHRTRVLGEEPASVPEQKRVDLARVLVDLFGRKYMNHPRLEMLVAKNKITDLNFLTGKEEAAAFENGNYVGLHQSTLRKVDILSNILERAMDRSLKTNASFGEVYGGWFPVMIVFIQEHWIISHISFLGLIVGIWQAF